MAGASSCHATGGGTAQSDDLRSTSARRFDRLDALRGVAIVWMACFHFSFDLAHFRITAQNFYSDPVWTTQRLCIVSLFLFCAGLGQAIAVRQGQPWPRFWRRWSQVAGCALLVSFGSWLMFPNSYISFGVLHCLALALVIVRLTVPAGRWLWLAGAVAVGAPWLVADPWFDSRWTNWLGLVTQKPIAEDYVPLLPWIGIVWWGMAAGRMVLQRRVGWLDGPVAPVARPLAALGRWSLSFYMLHQLVFIGLLMAWMRLRALA